MPPESDGTTTWRYEDDPLARAAVAECADGMIIGLGTGRAASRGIRALAHRSSSEGWIRLRTVATSERSADLARDLGLVVEPMDGVERLDLLFDGVDELAPDLAMLKGGGGAMTREKIVAEAAERRIYLMDESKHVPRLGRDFPLPVEVLDPALASVRRRLRLLFALDADLRLDDATGAPTRTDNGFLVLDGRWSDGPPTEDLVAYARELDALPGVVGHGLFANQADLVVVESADRRRLERLERR